MVGGKSVGSAVADAVGAGSVGGSAVSTPVTSSSSSTVSGVAEAAGGVTSISSEQADTRQAINNKTITLFMKTNPLPSIN